MTPQTPNTFLVQVLAVAIIVVSLLIAATGFLLRRLVIKVIETVDRVPEKAWFDKVEKMMDDLPDKNRWEEHFRRGHDLQGIVNRHVFEIEGLKKFESEARAQLKELDRRHP